MTTGVSEHAAKKATMGRTKRKLEPEYISAVEEVVENINTAGSISTVKKIKKTLGESYDLQVSLQSLLRDLHQLEYMYQKGTVVNILHDKPTNVFYSQDYVNKRLLNLSNKEHPTQPEVLYGESYCHVDHQTDKSWNKKGGKRNARGRQQMLVMFAAIMVHTVGRQLDAKMIEESVKVRSIVKKKDSEAISDYHGKFNADKFEKLFEGLSATLEPYGSCIIHMDGASRQRRVDSRSSKGKKKSILV